MSPLPPPPIGKPESLRELATLVNYSLVTITNTLESISTRLDDLVSAEKHKADITSLNRDIADLRSDISQAKARSAATLKWGVGIVVAVLAAFPTWTALFGH